MKCSVCGAAELVRDTRDLPHTDKGETTTVFAVTAYFYPACDVSITDEAETERVMREMQAFNKQVNSGHCWHCFCHRRAQEAPAWTRPHR